MGKRYPEQFKLSVVERITAQGGNVAAIARDAGVSAHSVYAWLRRYGARTSDAAEAQPNARTLKWSEPTNLHLAPRPKKNPKQQRSRHLVSAIRVACLRIIENEGIGALNTNHIAEVAGVGIGSVYQYFPNKDAILAAIYDELLEREHSALEQTAVTLLQLSSRQVLEYLIDRGIALRRRLLLIAPEFYQKYHREFELPKRYRSADDPAHAGIEPALAATRALFDRLGDDMRVPNTLLTQFIFTRGLGAMMDKAAEDSPALFDDPDFHALLKEMAVHFLLKPEKL